MDAAGFGAGIEGVTLRERPARSGGAPRRVVLLVDDEPGVQEIVALVLESEGDYEVWCASNGREALRLLAVMPLPDVMVIDMMMPIMDGWELLGALRADLRTSRIPVIVSSASCRQELSRVRVDRVLPKPLDYDAFLAAIEELTAERVAEVTAAAV